MLDRQTQNCTHNHVVLNSIQDCNCERYLTPPTPVFYNSQTSARNENSPQSLKGGGYERSVNFFSPFTFHLSLGFTLAEVLIAKQERGKMSMLNLSRTRELKTPSNKFMGRCAFTLAEVLITLGIIGVVAAMTIPTLIQNQQEKATVTALKKAYSTLSNAYKLAVNEDGSPETWDLAGGGSAAQGAINMINELVPYLNVTKNCVSLDPNVYQGCVVDEKYKYLSGNLWYNLNNVDTEPKVVLSDGSVVVAERVSPTCAGAWGSTPQLSSVCGLFYVDINGMKPPNQQGVDLYMFVLSKFGIVPLGLPTYTTLTFSNHCKNKLTNPATTGNGCTAWVLYNENMDYLHCSDLDWNTKTKCN